MHVHIPMTVSVYACTGGVAEEAGVEAGDVIERTTVLASATSVYCIMCVRIHVCTCASSYVSKRVCV